MRATTHQPLERPGDEDVDDRLPVAHAALFERARAGDDAAWRQLIVSFQPLVHRTVRRVCRSADVDDVVQEVWYVLLRRGHTVQSPERLPGWLRRVAYHAALDHVRWNRVVPQGELPERSVTIEDDLVRDLHSTTTQLGVRSALQRLKADERRLLLLLMAADRPDYRSISRAVGRPTGSIGPTRQRLLERLSRDPEIVQLASA